MKHKITIELDDEKLMMLDQLRAANANFVGANQKLSREEEIVNMIIGNWDAYQDFKDEL